MIDIEEKRRRQREADERYHLRHPEKRKEKDHRRYEENKEHEKARNASYYMRNREAQRIRHRDTKHHLASGWFDAQLIKQENKCAICGELFKKTPHIDHNHECCPPTKSCDKCRRALLCDDCNLGLGRFKDDPIILGNAIKYLEVYKNG